LIDRFKYEHATSKKSRIRWRCRGFTYVTNFDILKLVNKNKYWRQLMLFRIKKQVYTYSITLFIMCSLISSLWAGTDFVAIGMPHALHQEFANMQNYVAHRLGNNLALSPTPHHNLHITLKEIGDLNQQERKEVKKVLKQVAKQFHPHDITHIMKAGRLRINPQGLVMLKIKSDWLTALAHNIDKALTKLKKHGKITTLFKRMDFPKNGHITLGQISHKSKPFHKSASAPAITAEIQKKFKNQFNTNFLVDRFVLLKSNRPQQPRVYNNKGTFYL
jgi:2'-5' RNA ligase